eukprot:662904-Amphidinium_carterae.1
MPMSKVVDARAGFAFAMAVDCAFVDFGTAFPLATLTPLAPCDALPLPRKQVGLTLRKLAD